MQSKQTMNGFFINHYMLLMTVRVAQLLLLLTSMTVACPADSLRAILDSVKAARLIDGIRPESIGEECLAQTVEALDRIHGVRSGEETLRLIRRWSEGKSISLSLLYRCNTAKIAQIDPALPCGVLTLWEKNHGQVRASIARQEAMGRIAEEDSLFTVLDHCDSLSSDDFLQWAYLVEIQSGGYGAPSVLYCRALQADPRKIDQVFLKLYLWLENAPADSLAVALAAFQKGALNCRNVDTIGLQYRLADFYDRHDLYNAELEVLVAVPETHARLAQRLYELAGRALSRRLYAAAIPPAMAAFKGAETAALKSAVAEIAYRAYMQLHSFDSALVWLEYTGLSTESRRIDAVVLNQATGRIGKAKMLISKLPPTFARDTLALRQRLFEGDIAGAADAVKKGVAWSQQPNETVLWSVRVLLFRGDIDRLSGFLDSTLPQPFWSGAQEILRDRLLLHLLRNSKDALTDWSQIEYNLFIDKPEFAAAKLSGIAEVYKIPLLLLIIKNQLERGKIAEAEALFERQGDTVDSPEYLYLWAETLLNLNACKYRERAQALLGRIIRDFPEDVFSEKARVLIAERVSRK